MGWIRRRKWWGGLEAGSGEGDRSTKWWGWIRMRKWWGWKRDGRGNIQKCRAATHSNSAVGKGLWNYQCA